MPRKRTTVTETRTETARQVVIDHDDTAPRDYGGPLHGWGEGAIDGPIRWSPGHGGWPTERHLQLAQRKAQQERAQELIADWTASVPAGTPVPKWLTDATTNMLRAGPHATPLQLKWGRDI